MSSPLAEELRDALLAAADKAPLHLSPCATCSGLPPRGFTCQTCGTAGPAPGQVRSLVATHRTTGDRDA